MLVAMAKRNRIRAILAELGWTIQDLSRKIEMTYQQTHKIVTSERIPPGTSYATLEKFSEALNTPIDELEERVEV